MQSKVSIVMPCYNKVQFIGQTFDSILKQTWDNIEIILVNDGSTDGTGDVISRYEPLFLERGFQVKIVTQKNAGLAQTVKTGLAMATGDYICQIDADDLIEENYVAQMAEALDHHPEYEWCICDAYFLNESTRMKGYCKRIPPDIPGQKLLEAYVSVRMLSHVLELMLRRRALERYQIIGHFCTDRFGTQEASMFIPLLANKAKFIYVQKPLCIYRTGTGSNMSDCHKDASAFFHMIDGYHASVDKALSAHVLEKAYRGFLTALNGLIRNLRLLSSAIIWESAPDRVDALMDETVSGVNALFHVKLSVRDVHSLALTRALFHAVQMKALGSEGSAMPDKKYSRVIAYGALGQNAAGCLPLLEETILKPTELWDAGAYDNAGCKAIRPDFPSLTDSDAVLILPSKPEIVDTVCQRIKGTKCTAFSYEEIMRFVARKQFPQLFEDINARSVIALAQRKIKLLVLYTTFRYCGGAEHFLLQFLSVFPPDRYDIDLLLFDNLQDNARLFDAIPSNIKLLPFLWQYSGFSGSLLAHLKSAGQGRAAEVRRFVHARNGSEDFKKLPLGKRNDLNWEIMKALCPRYTGYDYAVAFTRSLPLRILCEFVQARHKSVFIHEDYVQMSRLSSECESKFLGELPYYRAVDNMICVTESNAQGLRRWLPELSHKIVVLMAPIRAEIIRAKAAAFYPSEYGRRHFNILTVARITSVKGIHLIAQAGKIMRENGLAFQWFILGMVSDVGYDNQIKGFIKENGLDAYIRFLGENPNPFPYYKNCDLYVQASLAEGRSLAIEEALALGCAVISTDFPSVCDQIKDDVNGKLCKMDATSLADAIQALLQDTSRLERYRAANTGYRNDDELRKYLQFFKQ